MRSLPSALVRVTPSGSSTNAAAPAGDELGDAAQRVGVVERALEFGVDDRVDLARLVAAGVADGLLAFGVGPAGAVGDHVAVVAGEQVADDRAQRVELGGGGVDQAGAQVVAEAEVGARRLGLALALLVARCARSCVGGVAQVGRRRGRRRRSRPARARAVPSLVGRAARGRRRA